MRRPSRCPQQSFSASAAISALCRSQVKPHLLRTFYRADLQLVSIEVSKEGVKFTCTGDIGSGSVQLRSNTNIDNPKENVEVEMTEPVALTFSLKYLVNFCKASGLSDKVKLKLSAEVPLLVEYPLTEGTNSFLQFYLAPKVSHPCVYTFLNHANVCRLVTKSELSMKFGDMDTRYTTPVLVTIKQRNVWMHAKRSSILRKCWVWGCRGLATCGVSVLDPITPPTPSRVWRPDNEKNQQYELYFPYTCAHSPLTFLDTPL
jgi:hypothetical protein